MRIRTKLLCFLLVVVLVPLCALGWYAWRETGRMGRQLAEGAAAALETSAAKELAQTTEMLGETCAPTPWTCWKPRLTLMAEEKRPGGSTARGSCRKRRFCSTRISTPEPCRPRP